MPQVEHLVFFKVKDEATEAEIKALTDGINSLKTFPGVVSLSFGKNISPERAEGFNYGLVVRFKDEESFKAYGPSEQHQAVVTGVVRPLAAGPPMAIDYLVE